MAMPTQEVGESWDAKADLRATQRRGSAQRTSQNCFIDHLSERPAPLLSEWKVKRSVVVDNKKRKTPAKVCVPLHLVINHLATVSPAKATTSHNRAPAFNPRIVLTKLSVGTTSKEFQADEYVFSQGDAADAVFYIASGKVKLTVVSERGKAAVVAILPEASFFGEGCLSGQLLRMSTASTVQRSTIFRVTK